jgi:hypothetical protein
MALITRPVTGAIMTLNKLLELILIFPALCISLPLFSCRHL